LVGDPRLPTVATRTPVQIELRPGGPVLAADNVVGAVLAAASRLAVLDDWQRLKICPADDCLWAFFDHSRNRSRTWCSMSACGNREKARAWRARVRP
jgi:predicted RNA-binding Zn ribbon-like protein